jgi:hypothetical protein
MKLSLSKLETARANPSAMAIALRSNEKPRVSFSRAQALYLSARRYHQTNDDISAARDYLIDIYRRNFVRPQEMLKLLDELERYAAAYQATHNTIIRLRTRISMAIDADFQLTGEIPRLDLVPNGGYAVWLFSRSTNQWREELRMPIIQLYFAQTLGVPVNGVRVGFYFFTAARYESYRYPQTRIDTAMSECRRLGTILRG